MPAYRVSSSTRLTQDPASLNQADYEHYQSDDQQNVNQSAGRIGCGESQRPQHQQNHADCPKHFDAPYVNTRMQVQVQSTALSYIWDTDVAWSQTRRSPALKV